MALDFGDSTLAWPPPGRIARKIAAPTNTEALISVFEHLDARSMLAVSKTCGLWRTIALTTPTLWWDLTLSGSAGLSIFNMVLQRSGEAPVHMDLFFDSRDCIDAALEAVYECRPRLVVLTIRLADTFDFRREYWPGQWAPLADAFKHPEGVPRLRHLGIHFPDHRGAYEPLPVTYPGDVAELRKLHYLATAAAAPRLQTLELSGMPVELSALRPMAGVTAVGVQLDVVAATDVHTLFELFPALRVLKLVTEDISALEHLPDDDARMVAALDELHLSARIQPFGFIEAAHLLYTTAHLQRVREVVVHALNGSTHGLPTVVECLDRPTHLALLSGRRDFRRADTVDASGAVPVTATVRVETAAGITRSFVVAKERMWTLARPALACASCMLLSVHSASWALVFGGSDAAARARGLLRGIRTLRVVLSPQHPLPSAAPSSTGMRFSLMMPDLERLELCAEPGTVIRVNTDELRRFLRIFDGMDMDAIGDAVLHGVYVYPGVAPAHDLIHLADNRPTP